MTKPISTVIRIAVAVNSEGDCYAYRSGCDDKDNMAEAIGGVRDGYTLNTYFVEALVEIPAPRSVVGVVTKVSDNLTY